MFFVAFPKVLVFSVLLTGACLLFSAFGQKNPLRTPLNEWPMIQAHDAATTYLGSGIVNRWAKTQQEGKGTSADAIGDHGEETSIKLSELDLHAMNLLWRPAVLDGVEGLPRRNILAWR